MNNALVKMLEHEREQLLFKLRVLEDAIVSCKGSSVIDGPVFISENGPDNNFQENIKLLFQKYHEYNAAQPTRDKVFFIIKAEKRFLHVREIARIMQQLENEVSITAVIKKVSPALSILKRKPGSPLVSIEVANSHFNTFWGCRDWLTESGGVKSDFMYNEAEITKLQREHILC